MSWGDTFEIQNRLDASLSRYQWNAASQVCDDLIARIHQEGAPYPEPAARQVLAALRKKRQFALGSRVAEAFIRFGQNAPRIRRQYATRPVPMLKHAIAPTTDSKRKPHGLRSTKRPRSGTTAMARPNESAIRSLQSFMGFLDGREPGRRAEART